MNRFMVLVIVLCCFPVSCATVQEPSIETRWRLSPDDLKLHDAYVDTFIRIASARYSEFHKGMKSEELRSTVPELRMERVQGETEFYSALFDSDTFSPMISANFVIDGRRGLTEVEFFSDQIEAEPTGQILRSIFFDSTDQLSKVFGPGIVENRLIDTRLSTAGKSWMEVSAENHRLLDAKWELAPSEAQPNSLYLDCDTANSKIGYFRLLVRY